jgi:hypothetical protein
MKKVIFLILFSPLIISGCGEKSKHENKINVSASNESFDECYSRTYKQISDENAADLLKEGKYKSKDEIPEQDLVPQGLRMTIEEDCKQSAKK